jgi:Resolvase, N terminal domain
MTMYGYARVSTDGQTLDAQVASLKAAGAEKVFSEKQSGAKTDRAALSRALVAPVIEKNGFGCWMPINAKNVIIKPATCWTVMS